MAEVETPSLTGLHQRIRLAYPSRHEAGSYGLARRAPSLLGAPVQGVDDLVQIRIAGAESSREPIAAARGYALAVHDYVELTDAA